MTATVRAPARLRYQPALDGLRAIAVVLVLLYHGGVSWAPGGFLGVDVFFALSGFLITWLLVDEHGRKGRISISGFYARRARRLLPALALTLLAVVVYAATLAPDSTLRQLRGDVLATIGYATNWRLILEDRGYFDAFTVPSPLKHTWSLAVEEQWYLLWPPLLGLLLAWGRRTGRALRPAVIGTVVGTIASAAWMAVLATPGTDPSRAYYGTDARAHELLVGALLALGLARRGSVELSPRWAAPLDVGAVAALGWILYLSATVDERTTWIYEGGLAVLAAAVALVVLAVLQPRSRLRGALAVAPLRWIGLISYGLYLWHFPVYIVLSSARTGLSGGALLGIRLAATVAVSVASFVLIERPVRDGRWSLRRVVTATSGAMAGAAALTALIVVLHAPAAPAPTPASGPTGAPGVAVPGEPPSEEPGVAPPDDVFEYDPAHNPPPVVAEGEDLLRVLATGDSVALTLSYGFDQRGGDPPGVLWDKSTVGCPLFPGDRVFGSSVTDGGPQCQPWRDDRERWIEVYDPDIVTILSGTWEVYDRTVGDELLRFGSEQHGEWFAAELDDLIQQLSADGATVVLLTAPCNERAEDITGATPPENQVDRIEHLNGLYRAAALRNPGRTEVIDLYGYLCPDGTIADGAVRAEDRVHFSTEGALEVQRWLYPQLVRIAQRPG